MQPTQRATALFAANAVSDETAVNAQKPVVVERLDDRDPGSYANIGHGRRMGEMNIMEVDYIRPMFADKRAHASCVRPGPEEIGGLAEGGQAKEPLIAVDVLDYAEPTTS